MYCTSLNCGLFSCTKCINHLPADGYLFPIFGYSEYLFTF